MKQPYDKAAAERARKEKYSSGNEGRLHPNLVHDGYYGPRTPLRRKHA